MNRRTQRAAWFRAWMAAAIAGVLAYRLWPGGEVRASFAWLVPAALWIVCARFFFAGCSRLVFAAELRSLRRRAARRVVPHNEARFELLVTARYPNRAAILAERRKLDEELERNAARRRLTLLEAGVDLPARW